MTSAPRLGQRDLFTKRVRQPRLVSSEFQLQCAVADLLRRMAKPTWLWSHLPFGEERPAEFRNGVRVSWAGERLKRAGTQPGWPDLVLLAPKGSPYPVYFLELKRKGGTLSDAQKDFAAWCAANGVPFAIAHSFDEALAQLQAWGALRTGIEVSA